MNSKASLLSLLTISDASEEKVFFVYLKELEDTAPLTIHWYSGRGQDGNADYIWKDKNVKQWCTIGNDEEIKLIFDTLINENLFSNKWANGIKINFSFQKTTKRLLQNEFMLIDGICACGRNEYPDEYQCQSFSIDLSFLINEENNCSYIEGYKSHENITPIRPYGLFGEKFLFNTLKEKIIASYVKRGKYWTLSGDRKQLVNGNPKKLTGFIQADKTFREKHKICIRNIDGTVVLGGSDIHIETGIWEANLSEPAGKGQFLIRNKETEKIYCGEKYYLINDIQFNSEIVNLVLVDLYGRNINVTGQEKQESVKTSILWDASSAPDSKQSEIELSDRLTSILLSLGNKIIFNDPYFFGDFTEDSNQIKLKSKSQFIFINALITAIAKGKIEEISVIGNWSKAKKFIGGDKTLMIEKYKKLFLLIKNNFAKSTHFKLNKFEIIFSEQLFHDRYWIGNNLEKDIIYHISNSINGAFESGELKFTLLDELGTMKTTPKIHNRYEKGVKNNIVS